MQYGATLFPRHPTKVPLNEVETIAFEELESAAKMLVSGKDFGRSGMKHAAEVCLSFFLVRGLSGQALQPLARIVQDLEAIYRGILPESFDPRVQAGRLPDAVWSRSPAATELKIWAAACMDTLMSRGSLKKAAAGRVARACQKWRRVSRGNVKPLTITNWRDELLQAPHDDPNAAAFRGHCAFLRSVTEEGDPLKEILKFGPPFASGIRRSKKT